MPLVKFISIQGDWSDIRTSWEQALRPTFMPDSMSPEAVVTTALAQTAQVSDMVKKQVMQ